MPPGGGGAGKDSCTVHGRLPATGRRDRDEDALPPLFPATDEVSLVVPSPPLAGSYLNRTKGTEMSRLFRL